MTARWLLLLAVGVCLARHAPRQRAHGQSRAAQSKIAVAHQLEEEGPVTWEMDGTATPRTDWEYVTSGWSREKLLDPFPNGLFRGVSKQDVTDHADSFVMADGSNVIDAWTSLPYIYVCKYEATLSGSGTATIVRRLSRKYDAIAASDVTVGGNPNSVASVLTGRLKQLNIMGKMLGMKDKIAPGGVPLPMEEAAQILAEAAEVKSNGAVTKEQAMRAGFFVPATIKANELGKTLNVHELAASSVLYGSQALSNTRERYAEMLMLWMDPRDDRWWEVPPNGRDPAVPSFSFFSDFGAAQSNVAYIVLGETLPFKAFRVRIYKDRSRRCVALRQHQKQATIAEETTNV